MSRFGARPSCRSFTAYQSSGACQAAFKSGDVGRQPADVRPCAISQIAAVGHLAERRMRHAGQVASNARPHARRGTSHKKPRVRFGEQQRRHRRRIARTCDRGTWPMSICAPSPPAKAISATATASPPSLRSWQARTSPARDRRVQRGERALGQLRHRPAARWPPLRCMHQRQSASRPARRASCRPGTAGCRLL